MNYGYNPTDNDRELAEQVSNYLEKFPPDKYGMSPYVEMNGLCAGVRIRRITHYSKKQIDRLVKDCDKIYDELFKETDPSCFMSFK